MAVKGVQTPAIPKMITTSSTQRGAVSHEKQIREWEQLILPQHWAFIYVKLGPKWARMCASSCRRFRDVALTESIVFETPLTFTSPLDKNGVFYWLGTGGGQHEWRNPGEAGIVTVMRSSGTYGHASDAVGRSVVDCHTGNEPGSWWYFDLGCGRALRPNSTQSGTRKELDLTIFVHGC